MTQTIYGLPSGTYTVEFKAFAVLKKRVSTATKNTGTGIAQGYVKAGSTTVTYDLTIPSSYVTSINWEDTTDVKTVTFTVTLKDGDDLEYGIQDANDGGQWYGINAISLKHQGAVTARILTAGDAVEVEEAELGHWSISNTDNNVELELNDWNTENDPSGMSTPNIDYWEDETLTAATISHYNILGLPKGYYKVSVDARAFNEGNTTDTITASTICFTAGEKEVDITSGTKTEYNGSAECYGTYEIICQLTNDVDSLCGIGFTVAEGSNCIRLSWKNLKVEYLGEDLTYSIGAPECSAMVAVPDGTVSIVFNDCISALNTDTLKLDSSKSITVNSSTVEITNFSLEGYTATVTFMMPEISGDSVTINVPEGLLYWYNNSEESDSVKATNPAGEFTLTTPALGEGGEYLIINVANGYYFGGGLAWGTTATQLKKPQFIGITENEDGTYKLNSHQYTSGTEHYLGVDLFLDSESVDWIIVHSDNGYTIYNASAGGYLTGNGLQQAVNTVQNTPSAASYWNFITLENVKESMDDATTLSPVDVTALIGAPELKRNSNVSNDADSYTAPWTNTDGNVTFGAGSATANCAQSNGSFELSQTITLPKAGTYTLSAQAFYSGNGDAPVLYAGDDSSSFPVLTESISTMAAAYQAFLNEAYTVAPITIETSADDATVTIGFRGESSWSVMGELELLYLGAPAPITWTMYPVRWGTLILPFDAEIPTDDETGEPALTLYPGNRITVSGSELILPDNYAAPSIEANTPYLVKSNVDEIPEEGITYTFTGYPVNDKDSYQLNDLVGTFKDMYYNYSGFDNDFTGEGNEYVLQNHEEEGFNFYPITSESSNVKLGAYHCYMDLSDLTGTAYASIAPFVLYLRGYDDATTGIVAVESEATVNNANDAIYDLSGRRVAKAVKGVYIINGKKVLVK